MNAYLLESTVSAWERFWNVCGWEWQHLFSGLAFCRGLECAFATRANATWEWMILVLVYFSWILSYKILETKCMMHSHLVQACARLTEKKSTTSTVASSQDNWHCVVFVCVREKAWERSWDLVSLRFWACVFLQAIYRHRRYCSDRKRRNGAHAASG